MSPANEYCSGAGKRISRIRSAARTVSSRRRLSGRAMELVNDRESFFAQARSILYGVRHAENIYLQRRLLILSDNLALVLALCKGRSKSFTLLSVMRRTFASSFRAGFVLPFRWIPSELNDSDNGSRFFDRSYDPSKSLFHVLAQRLTRSSFSLADGPTTSQDQTKPAHNTKPHPHGLALCHGNILATMTHSGVPAGHP